MVVPVYNEGNNVAAVVAALESALSDYAWEVVFVDDDSPDGTAARVREIAGRDTRVRCLQRIGRRGLASACLEGMLAASAPLIAVMDGDLQHDPGAIPAMIEAARSGDLEIVVGTRYAAGGGTGDWARSRVRVSRLATRITQGVASVGVSDPMSGFFLVRQDYVVTVAPRLSAIGFKILFDLVASATRPPRIAEVPYTFGPRAEGESKLGLLVAWEFGMLLADKTIGRVVPVRLISFGLVGGFGVAVHLAALGVLLSAGIAFTSAHVAATLVAMTSNYLLNNLLTYADRRHRGLGMVRGWLEFVAVCSIGAAANVGVANALYDPEGIWVLPALAGILIGTVWNYAVTAAVSWNRR